MPPEGKKWWKVYQRMRRLIMSLPPGTLLGKTRMDFAREYGVNHKTVNKAIQLLKSEGLLEARRRKGLWVNPNRPEDLDEGSNVLFIYAAKRSVSPDPVNPQLNLDLLAKLKAVAPSKGVHIRPVVLREFSSVHTLVKSGVVLGAFVTFLIDGGPMDEVFRLLDRHHVPVCTIDRLMKGRDGIKIDHFAIGRQLGRWIFSIPGVRRVLICSRPASTMQEIEREEGFKRVLDEMKISHSRVYWVPGSDESIGLRVRSLLENGLDFDAVLTHLGYQKEMVEDVWKSVGKPLPYCIVVGPESTVNSIGADGLVVPVEPYAGQALDILLARCRNPETEPVQVTIREGYIRAGR